MEPAPVANFGVSRTSRWPCALLLLAACTGTIGPNGGLATSTSSDSPAPAGARTDNKITGSGGGPSGDLGSGTAHDGSVIPPAVEATCTPQVIEPRVWRLSPLQIQNSIAAVLGATDVDMSAAPGDAVNLKTGFANASAETYVSDQLAEVLEVQAERAATQFADKISQRYPCTGTATITDTCLTDLVSTLGRKAMRRPLTATQVTAYTSLFRDRMTAGNVQSAAKVTAMALLLSPGFLYRSELGDGTGTLDPYEIASALSYGLTDGPPPDDLLMAAEANQLSDPGRRADFARKLVTTAGARDKFADFVYWQLQLFKLDLRKAELGADLVASLGDQTRTFAGDVLGSGNPTLTTLLDSHVGFVNATLAPLYGVTQTSKSLVKMDLPAAERFGLFTQPGWLAGVSGPIHRGKVIKNLFLCQEVSLPPNSNVSDLAKMLPVLPPETTEHDKWLAFRANNPACAACHETFQPLGLALDNYDDTGKYRKVNSYGKLIDTSGEIPDAQGWSGKFTGAEDLIVQIANSAAGQSCFAQRYLTYLLGTFVDRADASCLVREVSKTFVDQRLDLRELMVAAVSSDAFIQRRTP